MVILLNIISNSLYNFFFFFHSFYMDFFYRGGGQGGGEYRPIIHYRDLDAPREPDDFL